MASSKCGQALKKLREFGYAFNAAGKLCKVDKNTGEVSDEPFKFDIYKELAKNEQHYEKLAEQIPEIVYDLLEQNGLSRTYIPENVPQEEATFFFTQPAKLAQPKKLLVLIHGSGFVRAGQWARSLIINNSIDHGTQIPYIKRAQSLEYDILVTNTNDTYRIVDGKRKPIPSDLNTGTAHLAYIWNKYVIPANPESVAIVAHSAGGALTMDLVKRFPAFFKEKVFAIAFTDSAHFATPEAMKEISDITCNWVASDKPLDMEIKTPKGEIRSVSAGHSKHEWTSYSAIESVFKFLEQKYASFTDERTVSKKAKLDLKESK